MKELILVGVETAIAGKDDDEVEGEVEEGERKEDSRSMHYQGANSIAAMAKGLAEERGLLYMHCANAAGVEEVFERAITIALGKVKETSHSKDSPSTGSAIKDTLKKTLRVLNRHRPEKAEKPDSTEGADEDKRRWRTLGSLRRRKLTGQEQQGEVAQSVSLKAMREGEDGETGRTEGEREEKKSSAEGREDSCKAESKTTDEEKDETRTEVTEVRKGAEEKKQNEEPKKRKKKKKRKERRRQEGEGTNRGEDAPNRTGHHASTVVGDIDHRIQTCDERNEGVEGKGEHQVKVPRKKKKKKNRGRLSSREKQGKESEKGESNQNGEESVLNGAADIDGMRSEKKQKKKRRKKKKTKERKGDGGGRILRQEDVTLGEDQEKLSIQDKQAASIEEWEGEKQQEAEGLDEERKNREEKREKETTNRPTEDKDNGNS